MKNSSKIKIIKSGFLLFICLWVLCACNEKKEQPVTQIPLVKTMVIDTATVINHQDITANLEGISDIEVRPQVEGYLEKIYVQEGAFVKKGQPLFLIEQQPFEQALNSLNADIETSQSNLEKAGIEVNRLKPLVEAGVISNVQLQNAKATFNAAKSGVTKSKANAAGAAVNKEFTIIKAQSDGYIGRIPYRTGSLIGPSLSEPLTSLSDNHIIYAYFSLSEKDFLLFKERYEGKTLQQKLKNIPGVKLRLTDNSEYDRLGKVEMVSGLFDKTTGSITLRASFPNTEGHLRSGNTGLILLPYSNTGTLSVPQTATFQMQNKIMVYIVQKDSRLLSSELEISGKNDQLYFVNKGLKLGDRILLSGADRFRDDMKVRVR